MRFHERPRNSNGIIDIAPLVDTVFNLLIFFALSLNFVSTPGIQVNLPQSSAQEIRREEQELRVVIKPQRELYLNEAPLGMDELGVRFRKAALADPKTQVLIQADEAVSHGSVVSVMDLARSAGLQRLAIVTRPKDERRER